MIDDIIELEGGYVDHPKDRGGPTKYGISYRFYKRAVDQDATAEDIKAITKEDAKELYEEFFWRPKEYAVDGYSYDDLPPKVAHIVFGFAVNMGVKRSNILLQRALNEFVDVDVDGYLGEETCNAATRVSNETLIQRVGVEAAMFYLKIVIDKPDQMANLRGWMWRVIRQVLTALEYESEDTSET